MSHLGQTWDHAEPCGTDAAYQRHLRRREPPCYSCKQANARRLADHRGGGYVGPTVPDPRPVRNGIPESQRYVRGGRRPAWAIRAILAAEAEHGRPEDEAPAEAEHGRPEVTPRPVDGELLDDLLAAGYAREAS